MTAYHLNLLMQASTYAVALVGLTIVLGYNGQINLAQAASWCRGGRVLSRVRKPHRSTMRAPAGVAGDTLGDLQRSTAL
jgi:ABC-type branched-subunit amino acid transport system permease subunit